MNKKIMNVEVVNGQLHIKFGSLRLRLENLVKIPLVVGVIMACTVSEATTFSDLVMPIIGVTMAILSLIYMGYDKYLKEQED